MVTKLKPNSATVIKNIDHFLKTEGLDTAREKEIGQHIGYRYDVNLLPDYDRLRSHENVARMLQAAAKKDQSESS